MSPDIVEYDSLASPSRGELRAEVCDIEPPTREPLNLSSYWSKLLTICDIFTLDIIPLLDKEPLNPTLLELCLRIEAYYTIGHCDTVTLWH